MVMAAARSTAGEKKDIGSERRRSRKKNQRRGCGPQRRPLLEGPTEEWVRWALTGMVGRSSRQRKASG